MNSKTISIPLIIALIGFPQISETIYTPSLPNIVKGLMTSPQLVEATLALYFVGFALGVLLWGAISDFIGRKRSLLLGIVIYGCGTFLCGHAANIKALLFWRFVQAFGASVGSVVTLTIIRDVFDGAERSKLFSIMSGVLAFSPAVGPLIGGIVSEYFGWRANFSVLVIVGAVLFFWSWARLPETRPARITKTSMKNLFFSMMRSKVLWGHILLIGATNGIIFGFYQEAPFVFIDLMRMKPSLYGLFGMLIAAATIVAARFSYRRSNVVSSENLIRKGSCFTFSGAILLALAVVTGLFYVKYAGVILIITSLFLIFFGIGLIIPNSLSHALKPYQHAVGTAGSLFGGLYYCFIAASTWLMSIIHTNSPLPLPLYMTGLSVILIVAGRYVQPKEAHEVSIP